MSSECFSSGETSKNHDFRRAACKLVCSSHQFAMSFLFLFFVRLGHSSGEVVSGLVVFCKFVGRPFTQFCPSGSLVLKIWKVVVPNHSSVSATSLCSFQEPFNVRSEALSMLVRVCLVTSTHFIGVGNVSSFGLIDVLRYAPGVVSVLLFEGGFFLF